MTISNQNNYSQAKVRALTYGKFYYCRKLDQKTQKLKMAAIQNAIFYEIVYIS